MSMIMMIPIMITVREDDGDDKVNTYMNVLLAATFIRCYAMHRRPGIPLP